MLLVAERSNGLADIRKALRLTLEEMSRLLGVPSHRYKNWEYNRVKTPPGIVSQAKLLLRGGIPEVSGPLSAMSASESLVPYIGMVAASSPAGWSDPYESEDWEAVPVHMIVRGAFAFRVASDSMMPMLEPGDLCVMAKCEVPKIGQIVLHRNKDNQVTVKQLKHDGERFMLQPLNHAYDPIPVTGDILGFLVGLIREVNGEMTTRFNASGLKPNFF